MANFLKHSLTPALAAKIVKQLGDLSRIGSLIYNSKGQSLHRFQCENLDLIAKSYQLTSPKQKLTALLQHSRAHRAYRAALKFTATKIATPKPLLLLQNGILRPSKIILVTTFCPHENLLELLQKGQGLHPETPNNLLALLHQLFEARTSHGDFHARNLLVDKEGIPHLIDLDGTRHHLRTTTTSRFILKDRDRFLRSIRPLPGPRAAFGKVLGATGSPLPPKPTT